MTKSMEILCPVPTGLMNYDMVVIQLPGLGIPQGCRDADPGGLRSQEVYTRQYHAEPKVRESSGGCLGQINPCHLWF